MNCEICKAKHSNKGKRTCGQNACLSALLKKEQRIKAEKISARDAAILAELQQKENGVRKGTLLLLAICEHTTESPVFAGANETHSRKIHSMLTAPAIDPYPQYVPMSR